MNGSKVIRIACVRCAYQVKIVFEHMKISNLVEPPATCSSCGKGALRIEQIKNIESDVEIVS